MNKQTVLIGLNEINFDFLDYYISQGELPNFKRLFEKSNRIETESESEYHLLEPWIQWVTVYTGLKYADHNVYRLGDITENLHLSQLFEELEQEGKKVAAVSPFNVANKLKKADFFIPDPWTNTKVSGNAFVQKLYKAIHQAVNDNAQEKLSASSMITLAHAFIFNVPVSKWPAYVKNLWNRKKPGTKAIILDSLLGDIFIKLWRKHKPDFSNLFLNSGAHIQHHYMFNSAAYQGDLINPEWYCPKDYDPFIKIMKVYDKVVGQLMETEKLNLIIATGLHQHPHEQLTYYYRLNDHKSFIEEIGIDDYVRVQPRMSRDFLIEFSDEHSTKMADEKLRHLRCKNDGELIFDVDNRGKSLFLELIYPNALVEGMTLSAPALESDYIDFDKQVSFVAIKNGEHNGIGYLLSNIDLETEKRIPLTEVKGLIKKVVHGH